MRKIKAVIFDLDGTIGDTVPLCIQAFRQSIEPLIDQQVSDAEIMATFGPSEEGTIMALAPNHYDKGVADYLAYYEEHHDICPSPFDGMLEVLNLLQEKQIRIAMVTGKGKYSTEISLDKFGLTDYFEIIETGIPTGPSKPEGMEKVVDYFKEIPKEEMIYVGDAPSDITASRQVGIAVVGAGWAEATEVGKLEALRADKVFKTIEEFKTWLVTKI
ncbi:HAD hydrolase-like protein [Flammeovirga yaeyamensis]|uniref:phosphoglycolate phosphatase n=1 Tax=Flammeovirga yaeyamensis TaxID=367791 RepID=A0AAX1NDC6_9BACT|nr:HAD family hydrolase [Flammeovirga yaeyamensis]MBB3696539.1 phosphoglycolate phosphatase/pyrophosphatase PpaX [Flammeovirga yaeyamensis]NMF33218.1 HAD family hydrolase [Flammeovirga yaeyamensis]QWG05502.1 HAD hydrolase-like protein [Flammeovirga yaeyamensis]